MSATLSANCTRDTGPPSIGRSGVGLGAGAGGLAAPERAAAAVEVEIGLLRHQVVADSGDGPSDAAPPGHVAALLVHRHRWIDHCRWRQWPDPSTSVNIDADELSGWRCGRDADASGGRGGR